MTKLFPDFMDHASLARIAQGDVGALRASVAALDVIISDNGAPPSQLGSVRGPGAAETVHALPAGTLQSAHAMFSRPDFTTLTAPVNTPLLYTLPSSALFDLSPLSIVGGGAAGAAPDDLGVNSLADNLAGDAAAHTSITIHDEDSPYRVAMPNDIEVLLGARTGAVVRDPSHSVGLGAGTASVLGTDDKTFIASGSDSLVSVGKTASETMSGSSTITGPGNVTEFGRTYTYSTTVAAGIASRFGSSSHGYSLLIGGGGKETFSVSSAAVGHRILFGNATLIGGIGECTTSGGSGNNYFVVGNATVVINGAHVVLSNPTETTVVTNLAQGLFAIAAARSENR